MAEEMVETEEEMKRELSGEFTRLKLFWSIFGNLVGSFQGENSKVSF